jgi:endonuclease III
MANSARRATSSQPQRDPESEAALRTRAWMVHRTLCEEYGCPIPYFHELDPLSELVSSMLSHRTRNADSGRAFKALRALYPTWAEVRDAPVADIERAISAVTWPEQKAPRIQQILREISAARGELSLDFLAELSVTEAREWLERLPGVGPKTSAATLLFSRLRMAALPVDSHHHRVAQRLGLIPPSLDVGPSHAVLEAQLPKGLTAQEVYDNHEALMLHGQRCCYHREPACHRCPVYSLCPTGQQLHPELVESRRQRVIGQ